MVGLLVTFVLVVVGAVPALAWRYGGDLSQHARGTSWLARGHHDHHTGRQVDISGVVLVPLSPGVSSAIRVTMTNPSRHRMLMRRVKFSVAGITAPNADATHPCTKLDYEVRQMPRMVLRLPARRSIDLATLGVPVASWPHLAMRNRPLNQDGCQGATLTLRYIAHEVRRGGRS
jgi:hypothetical protein